jgi:hypothetical protein
MWNSFGGPYLTDNGPLIESAEVTPLRHVWSVRSSCRRTPRVEPGSHAWLFLLSTETSSIQLSQAPRGSCKETMLATKSTDGNKKARPTTKTNLANETREKNQKPKRPLVPSPLRSSHNKGYDAAPGIQLFVPTDQHRCALWFTIAPAILSLQLCLGPISGAQSAEWVCTR